MASKSEAGPLTIVTNSAAGIVATGGNVTARDVNVHYHSSSASAVDEFPLPRLIDTFRGREDEMRQLDEAFFSEQKNKVVICGLGGFGKSELAKQFVHQSRGNGKVQSVVWVEAENPNELKQSYKKLKPIYEQYADKQLLMIFDNCVNQQDVTNYEPSGNRNHRVLITSQYKLWKSDVKIIELEPLSSTSAMEVFKSVLGDKYSDENEHLYKSLAHSICCIPLGLQVVTSYVEQESEDFNLTDYVHEIEKSEHNIINEPIPDCADNSYNNTIYGAMITSIHKMKNKPDQKPQIRELAHDVLCFSAYLSSNYIKTTDLLYLVNRKNNECKDNELNLAIKLLSNYSFLRKRGSYKDIFLQHRTTQAFVRYYISESKLQSVYYKVCLDWQCKTKYSPVIFSYADSNFTIVHEFYKDNYMHKNIDWFLVNLVRSECIKCIKTIFKSPDGETKNYINKYNLLADCASTENVEILKILLSHVDINSKNNDQETALHVLAVRKNLKGIKFLVRHGADINVPNAAGDSLLFTFIRELIKPHDWNDVVKTLQLKADFSVTDSNNQTLLHAAATGKQLELIDFLIKNGLHVNQTDNNGCTPLDSLYYHISKSVNSFQGTIEDFLPILEKLLALGATSNNIKHKKGRKDPCGYLLLTYALERNNLDLLELLLNRGVDVNSRNCNQQTILHTCIINKNIKATRIVIKHNADCYERDHRGMTPLFYFVENEDFKDNDMDFVMNMLDLLQCHPGNVDAAGNTVLHVAVEDLNVELVKILLTDLEFDVNIQNFNGDTPLHALISSFNNLFFPYDAHKEVIIQMIKMFKSCNARLDIKNNTEETLLDKLQELCYIVEGNNIINDLSPYLTPKDTKQKRKANRHVHIYGTTLL